MNINYHKIRILFKKIPILRYLIKKILHIFRKIDEENKIRVLNSIPIFLLSKAHIKNTKILLNRSELLHLLPKYGVVAELGVASGNFSSEILNICNPKKLYLVDTWSPNSTEGTMQEVEEKFKNQINNRSVVILNSSSLNVVKQFNDVTFDWIYIDTDHSYKTTISELRLWASKIKDTGIIAGHDYDMGSWVHGYKYGVIEAVNQFCVEENWQIIYLTACHHEVVSYAIKKI